MQRYTKVAAALALSVGVAGCDGFLTGPGLTENPNDPISATAQQIFVATQASHFARQEGQLARQAAIYTQQLIGTNNQQLSYGTEYGINEQNLNGHFNQVYIGGGLVDHRKVQELARKMGNAKFEGVSKILEAYLMGTATSLWGDLPYSQAVGDNPQPTLDGQEDIYKAVQKLLDEGIQLLGGAGSGPGSADLIYGGNVDRWRRLAYTLKARYHLHTAERYGATAYQAALAAAQQGINEAATTPAQVVTGSAPGDMRAFHGGTISEGNLWTQFLGARQDIVAGNTLVQILKARGNDPRLAGYFDPSGGEFRGADQFGDPVGGTPSVVAAGRLRFEFRQPLVTWAENQLILAEAQLQLGQPGTALTHVNNVRKALGMAELAGPVTLAQIMEEKYIVTFQNIEAWSDYRRTCLPKLTPGGPKSAPAKEIPGRLPYGSAERLNNPNIPLPSEMEGKRNWNDPNPC